MHGLLVPAIPDSPNPDWLTAGSHLLGFAVRDSKMHKHFVTRILDMSFLQYTRAIDPSTVPHFVGVLGFAISRILNA
jgi:hypothetical protein